MVLCVVWVLTVFKIRLYLASVSSSGRPAGARH